ncbi:MAG: FAD-dependent oxidoreductase [Chloroflexota bacterium]
MARVLILGAGFGGISTAVALREQLPDTDEIVLIDRRDDFAMGLRKTWAILRISPIAYGTRSLAALATRGIAIRQGEITAVQPATRSATIDGEVVEADALVVALGAEAAPQTVPGLAQYGRNAWDRSHLDQVHAAVDDFRGGRVVVGIFGGPYPCPPAPYELAMLVGERFDARGIDADLTVFGPAPIALPILGAAGCAPLDGRLAERGITFLAGHVATEVTQHAIRFVAAEELAFDLLLAVPPHQCPGVLVEAGLAPAGGWVKVDRGTLETGHEQVYAIGDATAIPLANGMPLPKAGLFAQEQGEAVAARIAARLRGEQPTATFDGRGACFIEMGDGMASTISGDFYADPPAVALSEPSVESRVAKEHFEMDRMARWFGS